MQKEKIKIQGHVGTWCVIGEQYYNAEKVYLLEHETYGDMAASLIVNEELEIVLDEVWNGFDELYY